MTDPVLFGVLRLPYQMVMGSDVLREQFHTSAQQALDTADRLAAELARTQAELVQARNELMFKQAHFDQHQEQAPDHKDSH